MKTVCTLLALLVSVALPHAALAERGKTSLYFGAACYEESLRALRGARAERLSPTPCNDALEREPLGQQDRSIVLHNRGIIELAKGEDRAARTSFEQAAELSRSVDMRNVALAQLAFRQADYDIALQQYELLIDNYSENLGIPIDLLIRNRDRSSSALGIDPNTVRASAEFQDVVESASAE